MKLASMGMDLTRCSGDRNDVPIDFRFLDLLLRAADDPRGGTRQLRARRESRSRCKDATSPSALHPEEEEVETGIPSRPPRTVLRKKRQGENTPGGGTTRLSTNSQTRSQQQWKTRHEGVKSSSSPRRMQRVIARTWWSRPSGQQKGQPIRRSFSTRPF